MLLFFYLIQYEPIVDPDTVGIVHHILIYICGNNTIPTSDIGDCYGNDARFSQCMSATLGWAVGGEVSRGQNLLGTDKL